MIREEEICYPSGMFSADDLPSSYNPKTTDPKWRAFWEEKGCFNLPESSDALNFCLVMPPPNVTGVLHMGHALVSTLQDILVRWKRMSGYRVLWVPGTDHAGIATQNVVERRLFKAEGKRRNDYSREEFLEKVWAWKDQSEQRILSQLKTIGCSACFENLRFTMDEGYNRSVRTAFSHLFTKGLIYQGDYLVNWDPVAGTALSDDEVEYEERNGFLYHFRYPLENDEGFIEIATTRPETMLGDTAVAVAPGDERYAGKVGKNLILPIVGRKIPIIEDRRVDAAFGTGAVKITPAHDPNDYEIGREHNLPFINIMTPDGKIAKHVGVFEGMTMLEAREAVVARMKELGFFVKQEPHQNRVGVSYRSKATIEPYLSKQWFLKMSAFRKELRELVETQKVRLIPDNWKNTYFHWIDSLRDWCISRQLWWGHRIPVWHHRTTSQKIIYDGEGEPPEVRKSPDEWVQDPDVLDTWFSSALFPFASLGWPDNTANFKDFYPNSALITGHDILFFWVARMVLMGILLPGKPPFPEVFLHGLIFGKSYWRKKGGSIEYVSEEERLAYDMGGPIPPDVEYKWEKMSKSKGNVIDPLEVIDQFGSDAVRMTLASSPIQSKEIDLDRRRFEEFKNFANKIWNGARFVLINLKGLEKADFENGLQKDLLALEDRWILEKLKSVTETVNSALSNYAFDTAAAKAYDFFWNEFCSCYLEACKPTLFGKKGTGDDKKNKQKVLFTTLVHMLRLMHPMAPFITEELFQVLKKELGEIPSSQEPIMQEALDALKKESLSQASYPKGDNLPRLDETGMSRFDEILEMVYVIRNIRGEMKIAPGETVDLYIENHHGKNGEESSIDLLRAFLKLGNVQYGAPPKDLAFSSHGSTKSAKLTLPLPQNMVEKEKERLKKEKERLERSCERLQLSLKNEEFLKNAPKDVVAKQQELFDTSQKQLADILHRLSN